jgi:hypothetical protein
MDLRGRCLCLDKYGYQLSVELTIQDLHQSFVGKHLGLRRNHGGVTMNTYSVRTGNGTFREPRRNGTPGWLASPFLLAWVSSS